MHTAVEAVDLQKAATLFHALSDETRLGILDLLATGERCVCELSDELRVTQPLLSFHLKTLREASLVTDRREGRWVHYSLNRESVKLLKELVGSLTSHRRRSWCC
jgi:ArsR family transcriptional regulator